MIKFLLVRNLLVGLFVLSGFDLRCDLVLDIYFWKSNLFVVLKHRTLLRALCGLRAGSSQTAAWMENGGLSLCSSLLPCVHVCVHVPLCQVYVRLCAWMQCMKALSLFLFAALLVCLCMHVPMCQVNFKLCSWTQRTRPICLLGCTNLACLMPFDMFMYPDLCLLKRSNVLVPYCMLGSMVAQPYITQAREATQTLWRSFLQLELTWTKQAMWVCCTFCVKIVCLLAWLPCCQNDTTSHTVLLS